MKTYLLSLLLIAFLGVSAETAIPPLVVKAFATKYPTAQNIRWSTQGNEFKVVFGADGFNYESKFESNGNWKISQREIPAGQLPEAIRNAVSRNEYADWNVRSTYILFLPGMITQYRVIISKSDKEKSLLFSQDGKLLKDNFSL